MKITKKEWEKMKLAGNPERGKKNLHQKQILNA